MEGPLTLSLSREGRGDAFSTGTACSLSPWGVGWGEGVLNRVHSNIRRQARDQVRLRLGKKRRIRRP